MTEQEERLFELEIATREIADVRRELSEGIYSKEQIGYYLELGYNRLLLLYEALGGNRQQLAKSIAAEMKDKCSWDVKC